jgi:TolA-binding protein
MFATLVLLIAVQTQASASSLPGADFPPGDSRIWGLQAQGQSQKDAARQLAGRPATPQGFRLLIQAGKIDEALDCLRRIIDTQPLKMAEALPALSRSWRPDDPRDYSARLREVLAAAHAQAAKLPREQSAAAKYQLVSADGVLTQGGSVAWRERLNGFLQQYAGTTAALLAETDAATLLPYQERLERLDAIAAAHPGTTIAARALFEKAFQLGRNAPGAGPHRQPDPTERFLEVVAIARDLESGNYPASEWVTRASSLVIEFFSYQPQYAPGNIDKVLEAYEAFVMSHFAPDAMHPLANGIGYVITSKMGALFELKGDAGGIDRTLQALERGSADPLAARYIRALYALRGPGRPTGERVAGRQTAVDLLSALAAGAEGLYPRKALATLASLRGEWGDYATARDDYRRFVERYPESDYAWVAALRIGEMQAALGDWKSAETSFAAAASAHSANPLAATLGRALAADAAEALGEPQRAADHYAAALAAWDLDYGLEVSLYTSSRDAVTGVAVQRAPRISRADLLARGAQLRAALAQPGGPLLERGRWLLKNKDAAKAIETLEEFVARFPRSTIAPEGRELLHRAQLEQALTLANAQRPDADPAAAAAKLDALSKAPVDAAVIAARIARASSLWIRGDPAAAESAMSGAMNDWLGAQTLREPVTDMEKDVAAIREVVFRPLGDGIFTGERGWDSYKWPPVLPPFLLVDPEVAVRLPSGDQLRVSVSHALPGIPNVIYADATMASLLEMTIASFGESMNILTLWNKFFPARAGHWGGWEVTSYPRLTRIVFLDAARTQAGAQVTIGFSGATIVMEKHGSTWKAVRVTSRWVT